MVTAQVLASAYDCGIEFLLGDGSVELSQADAIDRASVGSLSFLKAEALSEVPHISLEEQTGMALVCHQSLASELGHRTDIALLISKQPRLSFMKLVERYFSPERPPVGVHPSALVGASARIDPEASIGPHCVIGDRCVVGSNSVLHPGVVLQSQVRVGRNVTIHANTVIGADGFGYERAADGRLQKFPHLGGVVIEDDVEIGSNTSIDRGSLGDTILCRGCKIDNQVHVAHNVLIGQDAVVIAQAMIGGSVLIGARAWIAPSAVIMNQVKVGEGALVGLAAVVTKDVPAGETVLGSPAIADAEFRANRAALKALLEAQSR